MDPDPITDVLRDLLVSGVAGWAPGALSAPGRRATLVYAYPGGDSATVEAALRVFSGPAQPRRGQRVTVVVLAAQPGDLGDRLGAGQAELPAELNVHVVPGGFDRLPVALKAAGAAGAPLLAVLDASQGPAPDPAAVAAVTAGRPAELLLVLGGPARAELDHRRVLSDAGFSLVGDVELIGTPDLPPRLLVFGTSSGKRLEAFKDGLWAVGGDSRVRYRDPLVPGEPLPMTPSPDPQPLGRRLLARLGTVGRCSVSELRQFTAGQTVYRAGDANRALVDLLASGLVRRDPVDGRLGGDVVIELVPPAVMPPGSAAPVG
ncbi:hypothetical protein BDK92_5567 [Micromonospora pisi]|uniref:Three-Cys-motif partner protein n=1 Tax=Micromonospora pisi TaxID=589240 RepID=A0A495JQA8_9ACTN|nr:hypothetical protein [Micromonospora pisi]RKR91176.1 hypothetical protein BDK92_5567 [Micromonospora pisi]